MSKKKFRSKQVTKPQERIIAPSSTGNLQRNFCIGIALFSFLLYAQSISFDYAYDDTSVIQGNKIIQQGINGIPDILVSDYWYGFTGRKTGDIYRPLSLMMFAIEWQLFGANPMLSHIVNVLLFSVTCVLMFLLLIKLFRQNLVIPLVCTLLYAAHPIHTEVVNNIKSRDEILCFLFSICSLIYFLKYYSNQKIASCIAGSLFFFLALLSKETAITFLVIIPMTLFVFRETNLKRLAYCAVGLIVFAGIYLLLRQRIDNNLPIANGIGLMDNFLVAATSYSERFATASYILLKYVLLSIFPHPLSADYSYAQLPLKTFGDLLAIVSVIVLVSAVIFSLLMIRKKNLYAYCILFFLVALSPVSNIFFLIGSSMAERFLYIPSFGFCLLLSLGLVQLFKMAKDATANISFKHFFIKNQTLLLVTFLICGIYTVKTLFRSSDWHNSLTLFSTDSKTASKSARTHYGYGSALHAMTDSSILKPMVMNEQYLEAKKEYEKALEIFPQYANAYIGLSFLYKNIQEYKTAVTYMGLAKKYSDPSNPIPYRELGYLYMKEGQYENSIKALDSFMMVAEPTSDVLNFKGTAFFGLQKYNEALDAYLKAYALNPYDVSLVQNIGRTYGNLQQFDKAAEYFQKAIQLDANNSENYRYLGVIYQFMNDTARANPLLRKAESMKAATGR